MKYFLILCVFMLTNMGRAETCFERRQGVLHVVADSVSKVDWPVAVKNRSGLTYIELRLRGSRGLGFWDHAELDITYENKMRQHRIMNKYQTHYSLELDSSHHYVAENLKFKVGNQEFHNQDLQLYFIYCR